VTRKKSTTTTTTIEPLDPYGFYRKSSATARRVIGLGSTATDARIKSGELEPPVPAFEGGRATGWLGSQLIKLQNRRLERVQKEIERLARMRAESER
jgi:hypothetical protein